MKARKTEGFLSGISLYCCNPVKLTQSAFSKRVIEISDKKQTPDLV